MPWAYRYVPINITVKLSTQIYTYNMNIFSKAALFFMMAVNLTNVSVSANDHVPTLRGVTQSLVQEEITPEVKLDAFVALMEARRGRNYCSYKRRSLQK